MSNCGVLKLFDDVTSNCNNDIEVVKGDYKIICLMSIAFFFFKICAISNCSTEHQILPNSDQIYYITSSTSTQ
jgi:hypothetical protein